MPRNEISIEFLLGKVITKIDKTESEIVFTTSDGLLVQMYHDPDCCESVEIDDIVGDLEDLIGSPILKAECATTQSDDEGVFIEKPKNLTPDDSFTWTFYHLATIKGYVTIKWFGTSNGYYSESVDLAIIGNAPLLHS